MATLTIRDLDDDVKRKLRLRAAEHGVSVSEEVRNLLAEAVGKKPGKRRLTVEEIANLGRKPAVPFDQKQVTDEMWDESFD